MRKYYCFAGVGLAIDMDGERMYEDARHLAPFGVENAREPYVFRYELEDALQPPRGTLLANTGGMQVYDDGVRYIGSVTESWENGYIQVIPEGKFHKVILKRSQMQSRVGVHTVLNSIGAEHLIAQNGGFVFHCAYIGVDGKAVLFTAPSGTGKSTQADLWQKHRNAPIHNGDRSAVRMENGTALACGIPFAGSSQYCENVTLPLGAIVYLRQAPETTIRQLKGAEAFRKVWEGVSVNTWDRRDMENVSNAVMQVISSVPVFELACTPDESAIIALEGVLKT